MRNSTHRRAGLFLFLLSPCYKSGWLFAHLLITFYVFMSGGHSTNLNNNRKPSARLHKHAVSRSCGLVAQTLKLW